MKKILLIGLVISIYVLISTGLEKTNIIPKDAIRIRILANSNSEYDQKIKMEVKDSVEPYLNNLLKNTYSMSEAKNIINSNMQNIHNVIDNSLLGRQKYTINFGKNYFPQKEYKGVIYEEGYYDSLLVKLGDGLGDNWWCVLFPPLCLLEAEENDDVEYSTYVGELLEKYF